jgi:hypothetical protein
LEVSYALKFHALLRFEPVDGDQDLVSVDSEDDRNDVDAAFTMDGGKYTVSGCGEPFEVFGLVYRIRNGLESCWTPCPAREVPTGQR